MVLLSYNYILSSNPATAISITSDLEVVLLSTISKFTKLSCFIKYHGRLKLRYSVAFINIRPT